MPCTTQAKYISYCMNVVFDKNNPKTNYPIQEMQIAYCAM